MNINLKFTEGKKIGKGDIKRPVIIMLALAAVSVIVVLFLSRAERITIKEPLYQYVFETADSYPDGVSMKKNEDSLIIDNGIQQYDSNSYPFYYEDKDALILTNDFLYMGRNGSYGGKVPYFTVIEETGDGYTLSSPKGTTLYGGMLHDGKDVFIFLEDTTVSYNGKTKEIRGLSYIVCFQGESVLIYNYGEEEAIYEELGSDGAVATMENGVRVDLVSDVYYLPNGTKHLLYTTPEVFETVSKNQEA
jgi:hypothetical protein